ncbi:hypothetical protein NE237_007196 [Protea cynaroides]|uniref:RING-type E3 ubiquitin transferase n=1 Tax=Protea cynaroides TaxID=273540 RepID=A0A9Q0QW55_9MAGN|nr:hypothetical protein NE237_007196 [Protea cynaroides]
MDVAEVEESIFAASDAKLHGEMCRKLSAILCKILEIFPVLEAARPRSKSGIQALCSLHVALEKAKNLLQHCSECSKLYLAITGDSVHLKFEKVRGALADSLRRVEDIVPQAISSLISEIVTELEGTMFSVDAFEKQVGDEVITLLQREREFYSNCNDNNELEIFHQAVSRLGITSSRAAVTERRALKRLIEKARIEEDKRKESIVAYLLHLMRKYSKLFRNEFSDDNDSQGSAPCSPTIQGSLENGIGPVGNVQVFDRQLSKLCSFNFKSNGRRSWHLAPPPEELRCPISLQLMSDPVIISSGQTYERICIEKWFSDGHRTCPKTQQQLSHLSLTPNYCVKGLVFSWCEHNGVPVPDGPPGSLDLNYWRLALSESEFTNSKSMECVSSCKLKRVKVVPLEESGVVEELEREEVENVSCPGEDGDLDMTQRYESLLAILNGEGDKETQCKVVEQIRLLLKDDEEARICLGANGFVGALVRFLEAAVCQRNEQAQEIGAMALFNLAVNNNRNKEMMLSAGVIPLLEEMVLTSKVYESATALYLNLSCLEEAKPIIGSSQAIPFLVCLLRNESEPQCKLDALHCLYNLSTYPTNIPILLSAGIIEVLQALFADPSDHTWTENLIAILLNLASNDSGKEEVTSTPGLISALAAMLDAGEPIEQEQAVSCLLSLCNGIDKCSELVLEEGVIPSLVSISVNGTARGKERAQKLLMLFRERRQQDQIHVQRQEWPEVSVVELPLQTPESQPIYKSKSSKMARAWARAHVWKSKNVSVYQH